MKGSLVKGKQTSLLPLRLQKNEKYDLKKSIPPVRWDSWSRRHCFFVYIKMNGEY